MTFTGRIDKLQEKGFIQSYFGNYYFLAGLPKGDYLTVNTNTREVEANPKNLIEKLGGEVK